MFWVNYFLPFIFASTVQSEYMTNEIPVDDHLTSLNATNFLIRDRREKNNPCIISQTGFLQGDKMPLILEKYPDANSQPKLLYFDKSNQIILKHGSSLAVTCPNKYDNKRKWKLFNRITGLTNDKENLEVTSLCCLDGQFFDSYNVKVDITKLACDFPPISRIKFEDSPEKFEIVFAFTVKKTERYLPIYKTTLLMMPDKSSVRIHYSKSVIPAIMGDRLWQKLEPKPKFSAACYPFSNNMILLDSAYSKENQRNALKSQLSCYQNSGCNNCNFKRDYGIFNRGHLASVSSMLNIYEQQSTFYYVNSAPQWKIINEGNWKKSEKFANDMAVHFGLDIEMYSGVHGQLTLLDTCRGREEKIYLIGTFNDEIRKIPVPLYFYKILYVRKINKAVVLVTVNNPHLSIDDRPNHHLCKSFRSGSWSYQDKLVKMPKWALKDESVGYSYMCQLFDFLATTKINIKELVSSGAAPLVWT